MPSAPSGSAKACDLQIKHTDILTKTKKVQIYHGSNMLFEASPTPPATHLGVANMLLDIDDTGEHFGWGISLTSEFVGPSSILLLSSVSLHFK